MNIIIYRGTHQIGGTCIELSTGKSRIILDIGQELPGMDVEKTLKIPRLPEVDGLFGGDAKSIDAILVSHGHGDHVGLVGRVNPQIPLFIGEKALKILNVTAQFTGGRSVANPLNYLISGQEIRIGDFQVTPFLVDHSGFDSYAFLIKAGGKCVVYTGDFRDHGRKSKATGYFRNNIPVGADALLIEGTMMSRESEEIETEKQIEERAYEFMTSRDVPVLVLQSAANIDRLVGMYRAAHRSGRVFVMDIFTAHIAAQLGRSIPAPGKFRDIRVFYPYRLTQRMFEQADGAELMGKFNRYRISRDELGERKDYAILVRDTMLSDLQHIGNLTGAGMIYSMWNGYKKTGRVKNMLSYAEANNMKIVDLHTSGHASVKALLELAGDTLPERIIPVHTEKPELFAGSLDNVLLVRDSEVIYV